MTRTEINHVLSEIDVKYKGLAKPFLVEVQRRLYNLSGFVIMAANQIRGLGSDKQDTYYIYNSLVYHAVQHALADRLSERDLSHRGIMFLVFHLIFNAPSSTIAQKELIGQLHQIDSRFPKTLLMGSASRAVVDDLFDLNSLLKRWKEVGLNVAQRRFHSILYCTGKLHQHHEASAE